MLPPLFFIVWGTKVRVKPRGRCAEFCPGCLRLAEFEVKAVENASHVYYISGRYKEVARFGECAVCGSAVQVSELMQTQQSGSDREPFARLLQQNRELTPIRLGHIAQAIENLSTEERDQHALAVFCENANDAFKTVETNIGGWLGLMLIVFGAIAIVTFALAGPIAGGIVSGVFLITLIVIRHKMIQRGTARILRPRLANLFSVPGFSWDKLNDAFESQQIRAGRLRRHLLGPFYEDVRHSGARFDEKPANSIRLGDYLATQPQQR